MIPIKMWISPKKPTKTRNMMMNRNIAVQYPLVS